MDLSVILKVMPPFWNLFLLFTLLLLIFLLQYLVSFLIFFLDLVSLDTVTSHLVTSPVHLSNPHHLIIKIIYLLYSTSRVYSRHLHCLILKFSFFSSFFHHPSSQTLKPILSYLFIPYEALSSS
jgi:hypothetical protein